MLLHGLHRHKQRLGDLLVARIFRRHVRNTPFARRQRVEAAEQDRARMRAGRGQLFVGALYERARTASVRELDSLAQQLPGFTSAVAATQGCTEVDERTRVLEP